MSFDISKSIQMSLDQISKLQQLEGENAFFCTNCDAKTMANFSTNLISATKTIIL